jgi:hypothetical protein
MFGPFKAITPFLLKKRSNGPYVKATLPALSLIQLAVSG